MVKAYVMIDASEGEFNNWLRIVRDNISEIDCVENAHVVLGRCDLVAEIESDTKEEVTRVVGDGIKRVDGVEKSETLITAD